MVKIQNISFPLALNGGNLKTSSDEECIKNAIFHVLLIEQGEYLMRPNYGNTPNLFTTKDSVDPIVSGIERQLREQINPNYPSVLFDVTGSIDESGLFEFTVRYSIFNIDQPNLVFRF